MLFNTVSYLVFLVIAVAATWALPERWRVAFLLMASLLFYALWRIEFLLLIMFSAWVDYFFSLRIDATDVLRRRRFFLIASLSTNLALLIYFKYTYFIIDNVIAVGRLTGHEWKFDPGTIVLPLGISFYTFLSISYTVDVYRKTFKPVRNFPVYLCYVMFWPHMIAGPILRAGELLPQLQKLSAFDHDGFAQGIRYILFGLFLKVVLADNLAPLVDYAFESEPAKLSALDVWTMAYAFGFQIYFDFAGYSMIAIGSARLLGVHFPENFNWPYFATSPREFWKRWHITLSSWIRDYLYLPLIHGRFQTSSEGGLEIDTPARKNAARMTFALFLTWFLMGLWHGASWNFALWGLWHAFFIFLYRMTSGWVTGWPAFLTMPLGWLATLGISMLGWIPFRARDVSTSIELLSRVFDLGSYTRLSFRENFYLVTFLVFVGMLVMRGAWLLRARASAAKTVPVLFIYETAVVAVSAFLVFIFLRPINQFIYFQF